MAEDHVIDELSVRRALKLLQSGLARVAADDLLGARDAFRQSAHNHATAEALTYWAWMEHQLGDTALAIDLCQRAIGLDPDFGNPYNDIGSYLIAQDDLDGAIPWLERAMDAKRYEPRHYPHLNLARVYLAKAMPRHALQQYRKALELHPDDPAIQRAIEEITRLVQ